MPLGIKKTAKPDPTRIYEAVESYSDLVATIAAGTRLAGSHAAVRANFSRWMTADLPDDQKSALRNKALFGSQETPAHATHKAPPIAERPSGRFRCLVSRTLADPDLASRARLSPGDIVSAADPVFVRFPQYFEPYEENR